MKVSIITDVNLADQTFRAVFLLYLEWFDESVRTPQVRPCVFEEYHHQSVLGGRIVTQTCATSNFTSPHGCVFSLTDRRKLRM